MSGSGREDLPDIREWSGGPPGYPGVVGRPSRISRSGQETPRMSLCGWEALPDVREWWEALPVVREWSVGSSGCLGVVGRPSRLFGSGRETPRMSVCGWETLLDVLEWSGAPPRYPGVVGRPFRMSESGREAPRMSVCGQEALPDIQEYPGCPCVVGRPSRMSGGGREHLPDIREW